MSNTINDTGITIDTLTQTTTNLTTSFKTIYGQDINLDSNSPDGQLLNIIAQASQDLKELIVGVYNSFDPDSAGGINLDARVAINGIQRKAGTYTTTNITVTTDRSVNLIGLDGETTKENVFTIQDSTGNKFYLYESQTISGAGTNTYLFRAKDMGVVQALANTITIISTIQLGVISVNNPNTPVTVGINEETDAQLRQRRQKSTMISSTGFYGSLYSSLSNLNNVSDVLIIENNTSVTDINNIPAHSFWIIVKGGNSEDIGQIIYDKRSAGTGMKGDVSVDITQIDGTVFTVKYDQAVAENLYIQFEAEMITTGSDIDIDYIKNQIVNNIIYNINQKANKTDLEAYVQSIYSGIYIRGLQFSINDIDYYDVLSPNAKNNYFSLSVSRIKINGL